MLATIVRPGKCVRVRQGLFSLLFCTVFSLSLTPASSTELTPARLEKLLKQYPEADANKDGTLTEAEARVYAAKLREKGKKVEQNQHKSYSLQPTYADVRYGSHPNNVFDFWRAKTDQPAPLVVFIHGGGFRNGDKSVAQMDFVKACLAKGVSFMTINYRFLPDAPIQDILRDCARSIQFVRYHAKEYGIDPKRIASFGSSAGAGTSVWLAFHDDLADPKNDDPVLRESSRIVAAGSLNGQATYDLLEWEEKIGKFKPEWTKPEEAPAFYHMKSRAEMDTAAGRKIMADCSMLKLASKDDAPVFLYCSNEGGEFKDRGHMLHHPKHVLVMKQRCDEVGIPAEVFLTQMEPRSTGDHNKALQQFFFKYLGVK